MSTGHETEVSTPPEQTPAPEPRKPADWEPLIRAGGVVVSILAALISGFLEINLSTLRSGDLVTIWRGDAIGSGGGPLLGLSILLAGGLNWAIAWFAVTTTRRRWALAPPWALWTLLMLGAAGVRTDEGDYLLGGENWVALVMILVGSLTYAIFSYRLILKRSLP
ncbi:hypothetical protein C8E87_4012 [Paractinoplanes brasiliensis]|uniref:Uncharacterized protein n=1 Tax=Paractinoplanes brasiliensis TaxID=52695 RepID=A0A4R6JX92_9ACTN|nr:hypothetical protein C8E87_4012 [Actinoplanes brasiliensis]GID25365.1 hypothetical protein Abr02nite_03480 [Actinoplanes brasiliensis]